MRVLISEAEIAARVEALAGEIAQRSPGDLVIVALLKGAVVFVADLARALYRAGVRPEVEFLRLSSYGPATQTSGEVRLVGEVPTGLAGKRVLLVDGIVDTGRSLAAAAALLRQGGVGELRTCVLLDKPQRRGLGIAVDFVGFSIGDVFVVGYGTDHAEQYRYLPHNAIVE